VVGYMEHMGWRMRWRMCSVRRHLTAIRTCDFLFVGGGAEQERLVAKAQRMGLRNVVFVRRKPKETMPPIGACATWPGAPKGHAALGTVIPSKIFEAMGMGCPSCSRREGEASESWKRVEPVFGGPERPQELLEAARLLKSNHQLTHGLAAGAGRLRMDTLGAAGAGDAGDLE